MDFRSRRKTRLVEHACFLRILGDLRKIYFKNLLFRKNEADMLHFEVSVLPLIVVAVANFLLSRLF